MDKEKSSQMFITLIYSLQMQAMMNMGKLKNPVTDKIEKDLEAARVSIDMIEMIKDKTINNLSDDENKIITHILSDLQLNFVEESSKQENKETK